MCCMVVEMDLEIKCWGCPFEMMSDMYVSSGGKELVEELLKDAKLTANEHALRGLSA